ncbi:hypothetical protein HZH68_009837 [Vespula germanica]|uniref:Sialin n=1 Tax=Vespula germanica TaxID=30212 RepID=A0A834JY34_VESGE|nr:hypothetical protein HZH68_009837 [Vespula germanica]
MEDSPRYEDPGMYKTRSPYSLRRLGDMVPARVVLYMLSFSGFLVSFMMRTDINLAMVAMAKPAMTSSNATVTETSHYCYKSANISHVENNNSNSNAIRPEEEGEFDWSPAIQSAILGSFYWCYILSQIVGGVLTQYFGTKTVFGGSQLLTAICSLLMPSAAEIHYGAMIALRSIQGIASGLTWPAMYAIVGHWIPPVERSRFMSSFQDRYDNSVTIVTIVDIDLFDWFSSTRWLYSPDRGVYSTATTQQHEKGRVYFQLIILFVRRLYFSHRKDRSLSRALLSLRSISRIEVSLSHCTASSFITPSSLRTKSLVKSLYRVDSCSPPSTRDHRRHVRIVKLAPAEVIQQASWFSFGIGLTYPLCGFIIAHFGWQVVFYTTGTIGITWCLFWYFFAFDTPAAHPRISQQELRYIRGSIGNQVLGTNEGMPVPWKSILMSWPAWAIGITTFGRIWVHYVFIIPGPMYIKTVLGFSIQANGVLSGLPFICSYLSSVVFCYVADILVNRQILSLTNVRKVFTALSQVIPGILVLLIGYLGCNIILVAIVWFVAVTLITAAYAGAMANIVDIAPNFAGPVLAFAQTIHMTASFLSPIAAGLLTQESQALDAWRRVFGVTACVACSTYIVYQIFGTAEIQAWNYPDQKYPQSVQEDSQPLNESPSKNGKIVSNRDNIEEA